MKMRTLALLLLTALVLSICVSPAASALSATASPAPTAGASRLDKWLSACDGYAFPQEGGVKYWLDTQNGLKLHCWMISGDPAWYEVVYTADLKKAEFADGVLRVRELTDRFGFPLRALRELRFDFEKDKVTMTADVDEKLLAGGAGDNLLGGEYVFVPWEGSHPAPEPLTAKEPFGELILPANGYASLTGGIVRFWLDTADGLKLHFWRENDAPAIEDLVYTVDAEKAGRHGDWITASRLLDKDGNALPGLRTVSFLFRKDSVLMSLTMDPGADVILPRGQFLFTPYPGSYIPPTLGGELPAVSAYDGYTCMQDGEVLFWLESQGARLNLTLHCFFSDGSARYERVYHIDAEKAHFVGNELIVQDLFDREENSVWKDRYSAMRFSFGEGQVLMRVEQAEKIPAGTEDLIEAGEYLFTPSGA